MKYLRILIAFLILVLIGIGIYFVYVKIVSPKKTAPAAAIETSRPFQDLSVNNKNSVVSKFVEYTSLDSKNLGKPITIEGVFQAADAQEKTIDGIAYNYVIGIEKGDTLFSVWLTSSEYQQISDVVKSYVRPGVPATLVLSPGKINFSTPYGATTN